MTHMILESVDLTTVQLKFVSVAPGEEYAV